MRIFFRVVLVPLLLLILGFSPFVNPSSAAAADTGDILVADPGSGAIRRYSATGVELSPFAEGLSSPSWITADQFGNIYVSEHDGRRISKFSATGASLLTFTTFTSYKPGGIRVSADGTIVYVADYFGGKVDRYDSASGAFLGQFVATSLTATDFIAFDGSGNLYVTGTDFVIEVVRRFSPTGEALGDFVPDFTGATGMAFDADGNLYVSSSINNIVEKFSPPSGTDQGTFASTALSASLMGMAFDASRTLYVANSGEGTNILRSSPTGGDLVVFASANLVSPRDLVIMPQVVNPPAVVPTAKEECNTDGWQSFDFKNRGNCIQYINTGK
jgi:sugar lactone lactonase YvrE